MLLALILAGALASAFGICFLSGGFDGSGWIWILPVCFVGALVVLVALAFFFLWLCCAVVDMEKPQKKDSRFYRSLIHLYIDAIVTVGRIHIHAQGVEKMPKDGRFLLVCNHTHDTDPIVLMSVLRKYPLAFISKRELDNMFLVGKLMRKILCQPINRENDKEALKTILKCIELIKEDQVSIGVFPEGYVHPDRKLHHFRHGVFKIAQKANVPIVVCTLKETKYLYENLMKWKRSDVYMNLLEVIPAEEVTRCTTVELGEHIYNVMAKDLGPDRVTDPMYQETT